MNSCGAGELPGQAARYHAHEIIQLLNNALVGADMFVGTALGYASVEVYFSVAAPSGMPPALADLIWRQLVFASVIAALVVRGADRDVSIDRARLPAVLGRAAGCAAILAAVGVATGSLQDMAGLWLLMWGGAFVCWLCASRLLFMAYQRRAMRLGAVREGIVVIGGGAATAVLVRRLKCDTNVLGVIDTPRGNLAEVTKSLGQVMQLARDGSVGLVILAPGPDQPHDHVARIVDILKAAPIQIALCQDPAFVRADPHVVRVVAGVQLMLLVDRPLKPQDLLAKLILDKCGAALLLLMASPMLLAVALTIMLDTPGPVLFRQDRTGWCGRLFTVYKFRTMKHAPSPALRMQTIRHDPRCTRVGSFLRRTSLDELPQLWNVLCGDMSLVGPRPHADLLHARERGAADLMVEYAQRQRVRPGLTGWAQVHGLRGAADTPEKLRRRVELDLYYIEHWSIWLDLKILACTPLAVLSAENAF